MTFGENIKRIRKEKGMSQQVLGDRLGVKQQTVAQYEKIQETPKLETVRRIAEALGVSLSELHPDWSAFSKEEIEQDWDNRIEITSYKHELLEDYGKLNKNGQKEARKRVHELTQIKEYTD